MNAKFNRTLIPLRIGIIAEDTSDVMVVTEIIQKVCATNYRVNHFVGDGCGRIVGKCRAWAEQLRQRGCKYLILVHDLDTNSVKDLRRHAYQRASSLSYRGICDNNSDTGN